MFFTKPTNIFITVIIKPLTLAMLGVLFNANISHGFSLKISEPFPTKIPARTNDIVRFTVSIAGNNSNNDNEVITGYKFSINIDGGELANIPGQNLNFDVTGLSYTASTQDIETLSFRVLNPVDDNLSDVFFTNIDDNFGAFIQTNKERLNCGTSNSLSCKVEDGANIVPIPMPGPVGIPEPFTIVGTLIGGTAAFRLRKKLKAIVG